MLLCALALWLVGGGMAIVGGTDIHIGMGLIIVALGVVALGIGGVCDSLAEVKKAIRNQSTSQ